MSTAPAFTLPAGPPGRWWPTIKLLRSPRKAFEQWSMQYGDPFLIHALNGPVVVTGRPDLIRQIFSSDPLQYDAFATVTMGPVLGDGSMLLLSGTRHREERKLVMPMFHGDRMRAYGDIMQSATVEAMKRQSLDTTFQMLDVTTQISLKVIVQAIFGGEDSEAVGELVRLSQKLVHRSSPLLFFSKKMQFRFLGISPWDRFVKARGELRAAFDKEMIRRQQSPKDREDILTLLLQSRYEDGTPIDAEDAYDELGTFMFAGHETSAIAMAWAMYHLLHTPETLVALKAEINQAPDDSPETLVQLPYLKAVVQETLRLHPIVTEVLRVLKSPMELDGHHLPAGTAVAPATVLAHYREDTFSEPDAFRPERFLTGNFKSAEYFPFGGGHRRCAGAAFASYEMAIALGTIVSGYDLRLMETSPVLPKRRNITMGPSTGIRVSLLHAAS